MKKYLEISMQSPCRYLTDDLNDIKNVIMNELHIGDEFTIKLKEMSEEDWENVPDNFDGF